MFKLLNKKGFTLVELMIVVVILGILVAIAVPIYSLVTKNAQKNTCFANMRIITSACVQYYMEHQNFDGLLNGGNSVADLNAIADSLPDEFIFKFDTRQLPVCPAGGKYKLEKGDLDTTIKISCTASGDGFEGHGDYHPNDD